MIGYELIFDLKINEYKLIEKRGFNNIDIVSYIFKYDNEKPLKSLPGRIYDRAFPNILELYLELITKKALFKFQISIIVEYLSSSDTVCDINHIS